MVASKQRRQVDVAVAAIGKCNCGMIVGSDNGVSRKIGGGSVVDDSKEENKVKEKE